MMGMAKEENSTENLWHAVQHTMRGANDYWYWRDKPIMEIGAARQALESAGLEINDLQCREHDPPDCEGFIDGVRCGVEVTELVHRPTLESTLRGTHQVFAWDRDDLCSVLQ